MNFTNKFSRDLETPYTGTQPQLLDTTLRDGEQSPGIYFTNEEKIMIAKALDCLGVDIIEAGTPGMGSEEKHTLAEIMKLGLKAEILGWNRLVIDDVMSSIDAGLRKIHVSIPTSTHHLSKKLNRDQSWVFTQMDSVIRYAKDQGLEISLGAEDASRTDLPFLKKVFHHAQTLGAARVRYADTLGILTPYQTLEIIQELTSDLTIPLDFQAHNDFGMATANAMCAWKGGAQVISCSLLGLGERAGNTTLEEFVGCMHFLNNLYGDFDFLALRNLCEIIAYIVDRPIPAQKPLFGKEIFKHESGIHVDGLLKNGITYEYFSPEKVGGKRGFVLGKHSGRSAVKFIAQQKNRTLSDMQAQQFLCDLRDRMSHHKGVVADELLNNYLDALNYVD